MTWNKLGARVITKLRALARVALEPGILGVAVSGGRVHTYLQLRRTWLRRIGIRTVVDIGANVGQFAQVARRAFPEAALHCFEPLPACFAKLSRRFAGSPGVFLHNVALADRAGTFTMVQNPYAQSSSLRAMDPTHVREFPWSAGGNEISVATSTLDQALVDVSVDTPLLVKIDVQGTEDLVIAGGPATLALAGVVIVETSFERLYSGQPLFDDIYRLMREKGLLYRGSLGELCSPQDGRVLQADSVFVRG